jgi:hypothetical protein
MGLHMALQCGESFAFVMTPGPYVVNGGFTVSRLGGMGIVLPRRASHRCWEEPLERLTSSRETGRRPAPLLL